ncbi:ATP-dependent DNA helicase PIF1 [Apostasia shenzhenica]|uniref:ATP-dependent DNA helicase PIF1 n=1 Tax=Apostasia shenzhenica TaxID=1088818 RepID=A0A2I0AB67_9ASPA|nr:ATP-dependent DNA helicase PIF1 [Apostasia shenzhenica]
MLVNPSKGLKGLIDVIYPNISTKNYNTIFFKTRTILASRNEKVDEINDIIMNQVKNESKIYYSADTKVAVTDENYDIDMLYTTEFLNSLTLPGLPTHKLELKVNTPIMLLKNLDQTNGLCNGTRLIVTRIGDRVIEAEIITGTNIGEKVIIPRIILTSSKSDLPFIIKRRQYPIKVAYAMTINKSQGQTLQHIGLCLQTPIFSHGQLYVALSRASSVHSLKVLLSNNHDIPYGFTRNIVYKDVLTDVLQQKSFQGSSQFHFFTLHICKLYSYISLFLKN